MRAAFALAASAAAWFVAGSAEAGGWTQPRGRGQVIVKFEHLTARDAFSPAGETLPLPERRRDRVLGLFSEYGLTDRLTLQLKGDLQSGEDAFVDYDGRGPLEVGLTWQAYRDDRWAISVYGGAAAGGEGRNAGYAQPGQGDADAELRASVGRNLGRMRFAPGATSSFVEVSAARRLRQGLPDETRVDLTHGARFGPRWMVLNQVFAGQADEFAGRNGPRWASLETSVVREQGPWSFQAGWRETLDGRETPKARGLVLAIWRRF